MSKAFKCDRCRRCFDPYSIENEKEFGSIPEYMCVVYDGRGGFDYTYRDEELHLCPECNKLFGLFMANINVCSRKNDISPNEKDGV